MQIAAKEGRQAIAEDSLDVADQAVLSYQKELIFSQGTEGHTQLSLVRVALEGSFKGVSRAPLRQKKSLLPSDNHAANLLIGRR